MGTSYNYEWESGLRFSLSATYQQALGTSPRTDVDLQVTYARLDTNDQITYNLAQTLAPNIHFLNIAASVSFPLRRM